MIEIPVGEWLFVEVARLVGAELDEIDPDDSIYEIGLQSVLLMQLLDALRISYDVEVSYEDAIGAADLESLAALAERARVASDRSTDKAEADPIPSLNREFCEEEEFGLSVMAHAYWAGRQDRLNDNATPPHFYHEFTTDSIDRKSLNRALAMVFDRHPMLRSSIDASGKQRILADPFHDECTMHDFSNLDEESAQGKLREVRRSLVNTTMDIERGEVLDVHVIKLSSCSVLAVLLDMSVSDARSFRILLADLARYYHDPSTALPPLKTHYRTYIDFAGRPNEQRERDRIWWMEKLPELPDHPFLPLEPRKADQEMRSYRLGDRLDPTIRESLEGVAKTSDVTLTVLLMTAFAYCIRMWSENEQFLLNVPVFSRPMEIEGVDDIIGDFTGSVLIDCSIDPSATLLDNCRAVNEHLAESLSHRFYPGVDVLRGLSQYRGEATRAPFVFTSAMGIGELFSEEFKEAFGRPSWIVSHSPYTWLDVQLGLADGDLHINWDIRKGIFASGVIEEVYEAFKLLILDIAVHEATDYIASVSPPSSQIETRRKRKCEKDEQASTRCNAIGLLHDGLKKQVQIQPDAVAVYEASGQTTFSALYELAKSTARMLIDSNVQTKSRIGICAPKGARQIASAYGVLLAGCSYVPISMRIPTARKQAISREAKLAALITDDSCDWFDGLMFSLPETSVASSKLKDVIVRPSDPAYVIFTSGSTGKPKGVVMSHGAALNTIYDIQARFDIGSTDCAIGVSNFDFDLSVFDIFGAIGAGASLVLADRADFADPSLWLSSMNDHRVTLWNSAPAQMSMVLDSSDAAIHLPNSLRLVMLSGDWVPANIAQRIREWVPDATVAALGGATEAGIWSNIHVLTNSDIQRSSVPYGASLTEQDVQVLSSDLAPRPNYAIGEIYIAGKSLADGYLSDRKKTDQKFVYDGRGVRWYKTGDLGRWLPEGEIEFLGRIDNQIKIHGNRIELTEIDSVLMDHSAIAAVKTVAIDNEGEKCLAAAIVAKPHRKIDMDSLMGHQRRYLPTAAICQTLIEFDALPLIANGKIDSEAIISACRSLRSGVSQSSEPSTPGERAAADAWSKALSIDAVGRHDSFFKLGGDSLSGTKVLAELRGSGFEGRLADLFERPTLTNFAASLSKHDNCSETEVAAKLFIKDNEPFDITSVQRAYLYGRDPAVELGGIGCTFYREYYIREFNRERFGKAVNLVVRKHPMLHAKIEGDKQQVIDPVTVDIEQYDSRASMTDSLSRRLFDPPAPPLIAVGEAPANAGRYVGIVFDNLIIDASSVLLVLADIDQAYKDPALLKPAPEITFQECIIAQSSKNGKRESDDRAYWANRLAALPTAPILSTRVPPSTLETIRFERMSHKMNGKQANDLRILAQKHNTTVACLLFSVYAETLRRFSGADAVTLTVTTYERPTFHDDISLVVGDFTKLVLSSHGKNPRETWAEVVRRTSSGLMADIDHASEGAVENARSTLYQQGAAFPIVFTAALGIEGKHTPPQLFADCVGGISQTPQTWLDCQVSDFGDDCITTTWDYVKDLFPEGLLEDAFEYYANLTQWVLEDRWDTDIPNPTYAIEVGSEMLDEKGACLHTLFFLHADESPDRIALIVDGEDAYTYGQMKEEVYRTARFLDNRGVSWGDSVVVALNSPFARITSALALFSLGGIYVPASAEQNHHRIQEIANLCEAKLVLAYDATEIIGTYNMDPIEVHQQRDALAYIIFTSGTTGRPKGIKITHRQAMTTVNAIIEMVEDASPIALSLAAPDFDLSIFDFFGVLAMGGTIVASSNMDGRDSQNAVRLVEKYRVTLWNSVPQQLQMAIESAEIGQLNPLRTILVSGDKVPLDLPEKARVAAAHARFLALGGATEASIWSNYFDPNAEPNALDDHPAWVSIPYGHPLARQIFEVRSIGQGEPCPYWTVGELCIGGDGVGEGYVSNELGFFQSNGVRYYRTGDLGRIRKNGIIEILGRKDFQVKIGGYRIELSELEMAAEKIEGVARGIAGVTEDGKLRLALERKPAPVNSPLPKVERMIAAQAPSASFLSADAVACVISDTLSLCSKEGSDIAADFRPVVSAWEEWLEENGPDNAREDPANPAIHDLACTLHRIVAGVESTDALSVHPELNYDDQVAASPESATALELMRQISASVTSIAAIGASDLLVSLCTSVTEIGRIPGASTECLVENESYECVVAPFSLHRFPNRKKALRRAYSSLRQSGMLVMSEPIVLSPAALLSSTVLSKGTLTPRAVAEGTCTICDTSTWADDARAVGLRPVWITRIDSVFVMTLAKDKTEAIDVGSFLAARIPVSHIPSHIEFVDSLPLSKNGKINREKIMRALSISSETRRVEAPSDTEKKIAFIWQEALSSSKPLSIEDNFFSVGGDSLRASKVARMIKAQLCRTFTLRDFLDNPTIAAIASCIDTRNAKDFDAAEGEL